MKNATKIIARGFVELKKSISIVLIVVFLLQYTPFHFRTNAADEINSQLDIILQFAESEIGKEKPIDKCQAFIFQTCLVGGINNGSVSPALEAWKKYGVSTDISNIPVGATVYSSNNHVGLYVRDGYVIHSSSANAEEDGCAIVKKDKLSKFLSGTTFLGWGWQGNVALDSSPFSISDQYRITDPESLNIRNKPHTTHGAIKGTIPYNAIAEVKLYDTTNEWGYITYNGISGWICLTTYAEYIGGSSGDVNTPTVNDYYKLTSADGYQTIRASASTSSANLGKIDVGEHTEVCITKYSDDGIWGYLTYNGISGWIHLGNTERIYTGFNDYYKLTSPDGYQTIRKSYNTSTSALGTIYHNSDKIVCITKYNYNKSWGYLTYDGVSGWISLYYTVASNENVKTVFFDPNGGACSTTNLSVIVGGKYDAFPTPTREGYTFQGWFTSPFGGVRIQAGETVTATSDHTLYAHWRNTTSSIDYVDIADGTYYIKCRSNTYYLTITPTQNTNKFDIVTSTFDIKPEQQMVIRKTENGYTICPNSSSTKIITIDSDVVSNEYSVDLCEEIGDGSQLWLFEKTTNGYYIRNAINSDYVLTLNQSGNICVSIFTGDISQVWALQNTVFYDVMGGTEAPSNYSQLKYYGEPITLTTAVPIRYYHTFKGWSLDPECKTIDYQPGDVFNIDITENISIYAVWVHNALFDIKGFINGEVTPTFNGFGTIDVYLDGVKVADDCESYWKEVPQGTTYEIKDIKATSGNVYGGLAQGSMSGVITDNTYIQVTFNTQSYTVTFKDWDGTTLKTQSVNYGTAATAPSNPSRTGYTFTGWDVEYNNVISDLTVTAMYIKNNESHPNYTPGDVNNDGYVDNLDAAMVLKYDAGIINSVDMNTADVNNDGSADNLDAAMILKYDAGIIDSF